MQTIGPRHVLAKLIRTALDEDIGAGDVTTRAALTGDEGPALAASLNGSGFTICSRIFPPDTCLNSVSISFTRWATAPPR